MGAAASGVPAWQDICDGFRDWNVRALRAWLDAQPADTAGEPPRVALLRGLLAAMVEDRMALPHWEVAYAGFERDGQPGACGLVARAALVLCVVDQAAMRHVRTWLQRVRAAVDRPAPGADGICDDWGAVSEAVLDEAVDDDAGQPSELATRRLARAEEAAQRLRACLEPLGRTLSADQQLITAQLLVTYYLQVGQTHHFDQLREEVESGGGYAAASPLMRARWCYTFGFAKYHLSRGDEAVEAWERGLALAREHGLEVVGAMLTLGLARLDVDLRRLDTARLRLKEVPRGFGPGREAFRVYRDQIAGRVDLLDGMPASALSLLSKSLASARSARFTETECGGCQSDHVQAMLAMEHYGDAIAELERLVAVHRSRSRDIFSCYLHLIRAWDQRLLDPQAARAALATGLHLVEVLDFGMFFRLLPSFVADLCALALCWGIERPLAYQILKTRGLELSAPEHADEHWPWQVWLRMLGDDAIVVGGQDVSDASRKMPSKTLQLLRFLCCQATLSADLLDAAMAVWPELVERSGLDPVKRDKLLRRNVEERIRDLRELVGNPAWIKVADSKVKLDARAINADVCARRRLVQQLKRIADRARVPAARVRSAEIAEADALMNGVTALSRGELLPTFDDYGWVDEARAACDDDLHEARAAVTQIRTTLQRGLA